AMLCMHDHSTYFFICFLAPTKATLFPYTTLFRSKFQMAAFVKKDGFVYMYGTPNGRFGNIHLSRVPEQQLLNIGAYRYWNGNGWVADQTAAQPVAIGVAGEMSVAYNTHFNRFIDR